MLFAEKLWFVIKVKLETLSNDLLIKKKKNKYKGWVTDPKGFFLIFVSIF